MPRGSSNRRDSDNSNDTNNNGSGRSNNNESNTNNNLRASLSGSGNGAADHHPRVGSPGRFGHFPKYTKPKIGPAFQCAVPKFIPNNTTNTNNNNEDGVPNSNYGDSSEAATSASRTSSRNNSSGGRGGGGRGGGRGGRGGRGRGGRGGRAGRGGSISRGSSLITDTGGKQDVNLDMLGARPEEMANAAAEQFECNVGKRTIPRGGLCVHRPVAFNRKQAAVDGATSAAAAAVGGAPDVHDEYLTFTRNMFLQTPQPRGEMTIDQIWDDATEKKFGGMTLLPANAGKKKGRKRKAEEDDNGSTSPLPPMKTEEDIGSDSLDAKPAAADQSHQTSSTMLPLCGLEDDERMLSFLQANHGGNLEKAKFSIMVKSDRGHGTSCPRI